MLNNFVLYYLTLNGKKEDEQKNLNKEKKDKRLEKLAQKNNIQIKN